VLESYKSFPLASSEDIVHIGPFFLGLVNSNPVLSNNPLIQVSLSASLKACNKYTLPATRQANPNAPPEIPILPSDVLTVIEEEVLVASERRLEQIKTV